jgi:1-deoxy-D-xylulose-5-phosphate reductoisomerase
VLNAANEVAVDAFLKEQISFLEMSRIIEESMDRMPFIAAPALEDYMETDRETRVYSKEIIGK